MRRPSIAYFALAVAALFFGATFVVIKEAIESFPPLSFVGWRFSISAVALLLLAWPKGSRIWKDGLVAGLSYSIVQNYLNRVVGDRRIGNKIFFQGGTAAAAAFELRPVSSAAAKSSTPKPMRSTF